MSRYTTEVIWPPFKGKGYKVVDASTGQGVGLYRTAEGARRKARAMNVQAATGMVYPAAGPPTVEYAAPDPAPAPAPATNHFHDCSRCGQVVITRAPVPMCATCKKLEARAQGEQDRLFAPAPTQMPGQMTL